MSDTTFTNGVTLTDADWFNDINRLHYTIFGDPANTISAAAAIGLDFTNIRAGGTLSVSAAAAFAAVQVGGILSVSAGSAFAAVKVGGALSVSAGAVVDANISWKSGTAFSGTLDHSLTAARTYTYPDRNLTLGLSLATEQASTSGTAIDFTSIPSGVRRVNIKFVGVSTDGVSNYLIQIGDAGGVEATDYLGSGADVVGGTATAYTAGFGIPIAASAAVVHGVVSIFLEDSAGFTWVASGTVSRSDSGAVYLVAGSKSTSAELDRVRITTANGTDAFDAGAINITYEF